MCLLSPQSRCADGESIAGMVVDLQGSGEVIDKNVSSKMQLLQYVIPKTQLRLEAGNRASVTHYASKLVYQLTGPTLVEVEVGQIKPVKGNLPVAKSMAEKLVVASANVNLAMAAYTMRSVPPITNYFPKPNTLLLSTRPTFRWKANAATGYLFTLEDSQGHVLAQSKINGDNWNLPANLELEYAKSYVWSVRYVSTVDGTSHRIGGEFKVAHKADADQFLALKPTSSSPLEDWVMYASMLQSAEAFEEAREAWREIARRRPDLQAVQSLAR